MKKFSEHIGSVKPNKTLLTDSISDELINSIWNYIFELYEDRKNNHWSRVAKTVAQFFLKTPVDELPGSNDGCRGWLRFHICELNWHELYDFIGFIVDHHEYMTQTPMRGGSHYILVKEIEYHRSKKTDLIRAFNYVFENELAGYRYISTGMKRATG